MGIGKRIKEAREVLGLTQKELGEKIGVTASAVTNYENGVSHPKEPVLYKLLQALEVDANYLFQDEMPENKKIAPDVIRSDLAELSNVFSLLDGSVPKEKVDLIIKLVKSVIDSDI